MRTVLYRIYHSPEGVKRFLQGKVFRPEDYDYAIYYRDVYPKKSTLWKTRYEKPEAESYNIDHLVLDWLLKQGIREVHYYIVPKRILLRIEAKKIERHVKLRNIKKEQLNGHTQYFMPVNLFTKSARDYSTPWINTETNINDLLKEEKIEPVGIKYMAENTQKTLISAWKEVLAHKQAANVTNCQQLSIL